MVQEEGLRRARDYQGVWQTQRSGVGGGGGGGGDYMYPSADGSVAAIAALESDRMIGSSRKIKEARRSAERPGRWERAAAKAATAGGRRPLSRSRGRRAVASPSPSPSRRHHLPSPSPTPQPGPAAPKKRSRSSGPSSSEKWEPQQQLSATATTSAITTTWSQTKTFLHPSGSPPPSGPPAQASLLGWRPRLRPM